MPNKRYNKQIFKMAEGGSISPKDIEKIKKKDKSIKEKILPKKKKDRLEELRKELG
tara:strand:- start:377 stop:544 length:168 start_codon:yes stop_codon:yes gene_type:complete